MRKFLLPFFIALLAGGVASAQVPANSLQPGAAAKPRLFTPKAQTAGTAEQQPTGQQQNAKSASAQPRSATNTNARTAPKKGPVSKGAQSNKQAAPALKAEPIQVNWMTIEEALEKSKTEKRKIYVHVYTDWCGWCKKMEESTFTDPAVAKYLNEKYYAVKFNAEQEKDVVFKDKTYHFKKSGSKGYHEFAAFLLNNRFGYPTSVFLDESQNFIQSIATYLEPYKLEPIINYFGTDSHRSTPWETYERNFQSSTSSSSSN